MNPDLNNYCRGKEKEKSQGNRCDEKNQKASYVRTPRKNAVHSLRAIAACVTRCMTGGVLINT